MAKMELTKGIVETEREVSDMGTELFSNNLAFWIMNDRVLRVAKNATWMWQIYLRGINNLVRCAEEQKKYSAKAERIYRNWQPLNNHYENALVLIT